MNKNKISKRRRRTLLVQKSLDDYLFSRPLTQISPIQHMNKLQQIAILESDSWSNLSLDELIALALGENTIPELLDAIIRDQHEVASVAARCTANPNVWLSSLEWAMANHRSSQVRIVARNAIKRFAEKQHEPMTDFTVVS